MAIAPKLIRGTPGLALKRLLWSLLRRREFAYDVVTPQGWRISGHTRDWIQRTLYYFGLWEPNLSAWIASRLKHGDAFVDVGANVGYFTLLAARCVGPEGKVVAIEAMPSIFEHLAKHVRDNGLTNTRVVNKAAVGPGSPPEVELFWGNEGNIGSTGMIPRGTEGRGITIAASTLSDILTDDECARARLIKIDVEGVEPETVKGLGLESRPFNKDLELIIEVSYDPERLAQRDWLLDYLHGLGFFSYVLPDTHRFRHYAYPHHSRERPHRLKQPLTRMHNVIFSRIDADQL